MMGFAGSPVPILQLTLGFQRFFKALIPAEEQIITTILIKKVIHLGPITVTAFRKLAITNFIKANEEIIFII
jgi:hypothetical protein